MAGDQFVGRYEIKEPLGQGGMAAVYRAYDPRFQRMVAIKLLPTQFRQDAQFRIRFEREAMAIAGLEHPAIVPVYDYGEDGGQVFLVMRLMDGGSLESRIDRGAISPTETRRILERIAPAIDFAHQQGVVHRDLKPGNILFDMHNEPYLTDFGIVKLLGGDKTAVTVTGGMIGTPGYMSPEQARGEENIDGRSDIYSLGVVCFEMLSGELPFQADSAMSLAFMHISEPVPSLFSINPRLDKGYDTVISAAMAKERSQRYESASKFVEAFKGVEEGRQILPPTFVLDKMELAGDYKPTGKRGIPMWAKAAGAIVALILIGFALFGLMNGTGQTAEDSDTPAPTAAIVEEVVTQIVIATATAGLPAAQILAPSATAAPTNTVPPEPTETIAPSVTPTASGPKVAVSKPTQQEMGSVRHLWDTAEYRDLTQPGSQLYSVATSPNESWIWGFSWCAENAATLTSILAPLTIEYFIDGELLPLSAFVELDETAADGWACRRWRVLLSGWTAGETVELDIRYNLISSIYDGRTSYPPGDYQQIIYVTAN